MLVPEDGLEIKFKDSEDQFEQLILPLLGKNQLQCSHFLMSYGTDPLILDQPEDDLDCGMLATSVIPAISKISKEDKLSSLVILLLL